MYESGEIEKWSERFSAYVFDISATRLIANFNNIVFVNGELGMTMTADQLNNSGLPVAGVFKPGLLAGLETEGYLSDRWILSVNANKRYLLKKEFGHWRTYLTVGIKYVL